MSNVAAICHSCSNEVSGPQQIGCQGYCNAVFHLKCSGLSENLHAAVTENRQIFWMCRSCTNLLSDMRHRKSVQSGFETGLKSQTDTHNRIVTEMKGAILSELRAEIRSNFATLINSNSLTPKSATRRTGDKPDLRKRLFDNKAETEKQTQPLLQGTGKAASPSFGSMLTVAPSSKFWLYITRISRTVTVEQVTKLAVERLGTEEVEVTRLVAKGKDVNTMSFISFKIGMDTTLKEKALSTSTWPTGLVFREFEERSTAIFWEPKDTTAANPAAQGTASQVQETEYRTTETTPPNLPAAGDGSQPSEQGVENMEE